MIVRITNKKTVNSILETAKIPKKESFDIIIAEDIQYKFLKIAMDVKMKNTLMAIDSSQYDLLKSQIRMLLKTINWLRDQILIKAGEMNKLSLILKNPKTKEIRKLKIRNDINLIIKASNTLIKKLRREFQSYKTLKNVCVVYGVYIKEVDRYVDNPSA